MKSILLTSLMAVVLCFCFLLTGCSAAGTYEFYSAEVAGVEYKDGDEFMGQEINGDAYGKITLNKDGSVEGEFEGETIPAGVTWKEDGDKVLIVYEEETIMEFTKDGRKLTMEEKTGLSTIKITFKK